MVWKKLLPANVQWVSLTLEIYFTRTRKFEEKENELQNLRKLVQDCTDSASGGLS